MLAVIIYVSIMLATLIRYVTVAMLAALVYYGFHSFWCEFCAINYGTRITIILAYLAISLLLVVHISVWGVVVYVITNTLMIISKELSGGSFSLLDMDYCISWHLLHIKVCK